MITFAASKKAIVAVVAFAISFESLFSSCAGAFVVISRPSLTAGRCLHRRSDRHDPWVGLPRRQGPFSSSTRSTTRIFLEDWVAEMIDAEIYRQEHKKEYEAAWMEKNRGAILHNLRHGGGGGEADEVMASSSSANANLMVLDDDVQNFRQHARDVKLAKEDPQRYCADRCITTGNCDVYEDFFQMSAQEVIEFCNDCVTSDGDEPCVLPESFYGNEDDQQKQRSGLLKP